MDYQEPQWTETSGHPRFARKTCNIMGVRNDQGRPKPYMEITQQGVLGYCKYCRAAHLVALEECLAVWGITDDRKQEE